MLKLRLFCIFAFTVITLFGSGCVRKVEVVGTKQTLEEAVKVDPQNVEAYEELGWLYYGNEQLDLAQETWSTP